VPKSNLKFGEIEGLEELLGDDGLFAEYGVAEATEIVMECTCCGDEATMTTGTQLQAQENAAAEEREDAELPLPLRACVNSEERSMDFKKWRELMDTGITSDYRCIRCHSCNDC
jgi:hypothetical protein